MLVPGHFFTPSTLFSLAGSATAVWIITSVTGYLLEPKSSKKLKKWLGLALSIVLALLGATFAPDRSLLTWVVAIVNGFLVYLTAVGANTVVAKTDTRRRERKSPARRRTDASEQKRGRFAESWW